MKAPAQRSLDASKSEEGRSLPVYCLTTAPAAARANVSTNTHHAATSAADYHGLTPWSQVLNLGGQRNR